ncbi:MAG: hypothetical protein U1E73_00720 [Planctomycetota bacterium]
MFSLSLALAAQTLTSVTATDLNIVYRQGPLPIGNHNPVPCDIRMGGALSTDHAYAHWWYFRLLGDGREFAFRDDGSAVRTVTGNRIVCTWSDVDARGLVSARQDTQCFGDGGSTGLVVDRMTLTNLSAQPVTIDVFAYADLDVCGTFLGDHAAGSPTGSIVDDSGCSQTVSFFAVGSDRFEVQEFNPSPPASSIRSRLVDSSADNLVSWNGQFGPGDYTAAAQWTMRSIQPRESVTFQTLFELSMSLTAMPAASARGTRGGAASGPSIAAGVAAISSGGPARGLDFDLAAAPSTSLCCVAMSPIAQNIALPGLSVYIGLNPVAVSYQVTDSLGGAHYSMTVPPAAGYYGLPISAQWFVLPATGGLAVVNSNAADCVVGGW